MTPQKTPLSARLKRFWANMLTPINAYLGTALIVLALIMALMMALVGLSGGHMGGHVDISVMRDGGDVSVRMPENMMPDGQNHHGQNHYGQNQDSWHRDGHHDGHHGYGHHGRYMGGGHFGGGYFGWSAGLFGLVLAAGLAAMVGLVTQLIRIEGHLAALRYTMEDSSASAYATLALIFYPHPQKKSRAEALLFSSPPLEYWMIRNVPNWWPDFWRLAGQIWSNQSLQRPVYIPRLWGCAPK